MDSLDNSDYKIYSQNGEDGVISKIFDSIGLTNKFFVEFGVENGTECNTRHLREKLGWSGLMMDGSHENLVINLRKEFITAENIVSLFEKYKVPIEFDFLSLDIDFNDWYVWKAISKKYSPRVVCIEYNSSHLPGEDKVVKYDPNGCWDGTNYFGASYTALVNLANSIGYTIVYAENMGVNLFFIRNDVLNGWRPSASLYKPPRYGYNGNGHRRDPYNREYVKSQDMISDIHDISERL